MQAVRRGETVRLSGRFLLSSSNRCDKDNSRTGLFGRAPGDDEFEIGSGAAQSRDGCCQPTWAVGHFARPDIDFFDCVRHRFTSSIEIWPEPIGIQTVEMLREETSNTLFQIDSLPNCAINSTRSTSQTRCVSSGSSFVA